MGGAVETVNVERAQFSQLPAQDDLNKTEPDWSLKDQAACLLENGVSGNVSSRIPPGSD